LPEGAYGDLRDPSLALERTDPVLRLLGVEPAVERDVVAVAAHDAPRVATRVRGRPLTAQRVVDIEGAPVGALRRRAVRESSAEADAVVDPRPELEAVEESRALQCGLRLGSRSSARRRL